MGKETLEKLRDEGYKLSAKRKIVLNLLEQNSDQFLSVDKMYDLLKEDAHSINLSTIYRNLEVLNGLGLVHKVISLDGKTLYGLKRDLAHHHHIICEKCGKTSKIDYCPKENYTKLASELGYTLTEHRIELFGICSNCK